MSTSKEYKAVHNFFKNTCGLSEQDIKNIITEVIQNIVERELRDYFRTNEFISLIGKRLTMYRYGTFEEGIRGDITKAVEKAVKEKLDNMGLKISFDKEGV